MLKGTSTDVPGTRLGPGQTDTLLLSGSLIWWWRGISSCLNQVLPARMAKLRFFTELHVP